MGEKQKWKAAAKRAQMRWRRRPPQDYSARFLDIFSKNESTVRFFLAFSSLALIHAIFFCLNVNSALWAYIDASFVFSVAFFFSLVMAAAIFFSRISPFIILTLIFIFRIAVIFPAQVFWKFRISGLQFKDFFKGRLSEIYIALPDGIIPSVKFRHLISLDRAWWAVLPVLIFPTPSDVELVMKSHMDSIHKFKFLTSLSRIVAPIFVLCQFYTGWSYLLFLLAVFYFLLFAALPDLEAIFSVIRSIRRESNGGGGYMAGAAGAFSNADSAFRSRMVLLTFMFAGSISASSGYFHFYHALTRDPTWLDFGGERVLFKPIKFSSGMVFGITADGAQAFVPLEAVRSTCSSGDMLLLQNDPCLAIVSSSE